LGGPASLVQEKKKGNGSFKKRGERATTREKKRRKKKRGDGPLDKRPRGEGNPRGFLAKIPRRIFPGWDPNHQKFFEKKGEDGVGPAPKREVCMRRKRGGGAGKNSGGYIKKKNRHLKAVVLAGEG